VDRKILGYLLTGLVLIVFQEEGALTWKLFPTLGLTLLVIVYLAFLLKPRRASDSVAATAGRGSDDAPVESGETPSSG
jgi:uncharacterized membrane protein